MRTSPRFELRASAGGSRCRNERRLGGPTEKATAGRYLVTGVNVVKKPNSPNPRDAAADGVNTADKP